MIEMIHLFKELKTELLNIILLNGFLNSMIMFLGTFLILTIFDAHYIFSLVIPLVYFLIYFITKASQIRLIAVEENNPGVSEILRTANDYRHQDSIMVQALFHDLVAKMKSVRTSTFLNPKKIFIKVSLIVVLAYAVVTISALGIYLGSIPKIDVKMPEFLDFAKLYKFGGQQQNLTDWTNNTDDIYGDSDTFKLRDEVLNLEISTVKSSIDISQVQDAKGTGFVEGDYPAEDTGLQAQDAYTSTISQEHRELVKKYFKELNDEANAK